MIYKGKPFNVRKATTDHWYDVAIGSSSSHISIELINKEKHVRIGLYMVDDKEYFDKLFANKDTIETQLGIKLEWQRECSGNVSRVKYKLPGLDYDNHSNYDELINKSIDIAANMQKVFKKYI